MLPEKIPIFEKLARSRYRFLLREAKHRTGSGFSRSTTWGVGADRDGPSRVLMIDLADGSETTVFPGPSSEVKSPSRPIGEGCSPPSPDRGSCEIEIATGKVLTDFHDIAGDAQVVNFPGTPGPRYVLNP